MGRLASRLPRYPIGTTGVTDVINLEDNERINFGDSNDYYIYFDGTDFLIDSGTHSLEIDLATAGSSIIYGGNASGDRLKLYANSVDAYSALFLSKDYASINLAAGNSLFVTIGGSDVGKLTGDASYFILQAHPANRGVKLLTTGTAVILNSTVTPTGDAAKIGWNVVTSTGNIVGLEIDASTNLTMGVNFGVTGLKIAVKAANGVGESYGIDLSGVPNSEITAKLLNTADATTYTVGIDAQAGSIKIQVGATAYYMPYWTVDGA